MLGEKKKKNVGCGGAGRVGWFRWVFVSVLPPPFPHNFFSETRSETETEKILNIQGEGGGGGEEKDKFAGFGGLGARRDFQKGDCRGGGNRKRGGFFKRKIEGDSKVVEKTRIFGAVKDRIDFV